MAGAPKRYARRHKLATDKQLWRLNEQGLVRIVLAEDTFVPGGPPEGWLSVGYEEAATLVGRLDEERWAGLGRWPKPGELWTLREGVVQSLGQAKESETQT